MPTYGRTALLGVLLGSLVAGCVEPPPPRTFAEFMEDRIAREGALARCGEDSRASLSDIECANARRAQATIALREERERREALELESERKLAALRDQMALRQRAEREAAAAAEAAAQAAYEAFWRENSPDGRPPEDATYPTRLGVPPSGGASGAGLPADGSLVAVPDEIVTSPSTGEITTVEVPGSEPPTREPGDEADAIVEPRPLQRR